MPDNAEIFIESVKNNSRLLIQRGLLDIGMVRFDSWLRQFCGDEEEFFAACLLDQIIFRTTQQFEAGLRSLFRSNLNGLVFSDEPDLKLLQTLIGKSELKLRLVPVICETDPPTKSGPLVLRRLQRILQIRDHWMSWPWQAVEKIRNEEVNTVVFVDDFLGSGTQFVGFFKQWRFHELPPNVHYIYAPVVAHQ